MIDIDMAVGCIAAIVFDLWIHLHWQKVTRHMRGTVVYRVAFLPVQEYLLSGVSVTIFDIGMANALCQESNHQPGRMHPADSVVVESQK